MAGASQTRKSAVQIYQLVSSSIQFESQTYYLRHSTIQQFFWLGAGF